MSDVDYRLRSQVSDLQRMVVQLGTAVDQVRDRVDQNTEVQQATRSLLTDFYERFQQFATLQLRATVIQNSKIEIDTLEQRLENEYGHFNRVRRTAVGILQSFDMGLVSQETLRNVSEDQLITVPRYWLAPAVVALAAWVRDDRQTCDRGIEYAFSRSPERTSLLMALVLRRQLRQAGAVRWLRHYLEAQDPKALKREFAVILESISRGAFGAAALDLVQEHIGRWRASLLSDDNARQSQVDRWKIEIASYQERSAAARFPRLAVLSPEWKHLETALTSAETHQRLVSSYRELIGEAVPPSADLEHRVDDIVDRLVAEYDPEELPLRRQLAYHQAVVSHEGDVEAAAQAAQQHLMALEETRDYLSIETESALHPEAIGVSRATQRIALAACGDWIAAAHAEFTAGYRAQCPGQVTVVFGRHHSDGAQVLGMRKWLGRLGWQDEELERDLAQHWDIHGDQYVESLAYHPRNDIGILIGIAVAALVLVGACVHPTAGLVVSALGALIYAGVILRKKAAAQRAQRAARELVHSSREAAVRDLRRAMQEYTDWRREYAAADSQEGEFQAVIGELTTIGATPPTERRMIERPE